MSSTVPQDDYLLSRDYIDCDRLNLQHSLWTKIFGYSLHPCIDTSSPTLTIADVGTGTASWLTDLAALLPATCRLDGFDIDTSQAPPKEWLPANVSLHEWDIFTDLPEYLIGRYDIIHVRLLIFVVKGDPTGILRNLVRMLKPGGWLQWSEPDVRTMRILTTKVKTQTQPGAPSGPDTDTNAASPTNANATPGMAHLFSLSASQDPRLIPAWPCQLDEYYRAAGLNDVLVHRVAEAPPHLEFAMHQCNLLMYEMFASRAPGPRAKKIRDWVPRAAEETRRGAMFAFERVAVVGCKGKQ
ncbi:S-adenosyl-L-methionine-dependent methyltransferase [Aspergillus germanicus]